MRIDDASVKKILLEENYVSKEDLAAAESGVAKGSTIVDYLLSHELLSKELLGQAIAESFGVAYAPLEGDQALRDRIPEEVAVKLHVTVAEEDKKHIVVATDDPKQKGLLQELAHLFPEKKATLAYALPEQIDAVLRGYRKPLATRFSQIIAENGRVAPELIEQIFADALSFRASDIHLEPRPTEVVVRFRVDGVLQEAGRLPREHYDNMLNRIKVQSRLRIDEHFMAQDGSLTYTADTVTVDMRVSVVPTVDGEKVVLRVLAAYVQGLSLTDLGLTDHDQKLLSTAAAKPFGMILATGPTGAGKTTTLYALLKLLNQPDVNITTIEDPVEYKVRGINQIQVNPQTNLTFAQGLRSIVRQDPDIILVGEIRDEETAEIAINAALTGHLLLSTFHANDAATAIPRLLDMGLEPFLLASTLEVIIAQRLVRKICDHCRYSVSVSTVRMPLPPEVKKHYFTGKQVTLYRGKGCEVCGHTGFQGRTALFEFIPVTPALEELILKRPSTQEIARLAEAEGMHTLFADGITKVKGGVTTLDELLRVVEVPEVLTPAKKV